MCCTAGKLPQVRADATEGATVQKYVALAREGQHALMGDDVDWFHIDEVRAKESVFGQRVAHGMLVTSIATGLQVEKMEPKIATAAFVGLDSWQFRAPVFIGDTIRVKRTIGEKAENEKNPKAGWCKYEIEVLNQEDKVVQRGVWNMLIQRKG